MRVLLLSLVLISSMAHAGIKIVGQREADSTLANGLSIHFLEMKKEITVPQIPGVTYHATDTRFVYSTPTLPELEAYGVVQFIRGCVFESQLVNGKVEKTLSVSRDYFDASGKAVKSIFQHPHWQIDNDNADPMYSSYEGASRFRLFFAGNDDPKSLDADNAHYYQSKKPSVPKVFVTDLPAAGAYDVLYRTAKNPSLEFQTCIFRLVDLPLTTTPDAAGVDIKKALWCVQWEHKYVWNFASKKIESPKAIDPVCAMD